MGERLAAGIEAPVERVARAADTLGRVRSLAADGAVHGATVLAGPAPPGDADRELAGSSVLDACVLVRPSGAAESAGRVALAATLAAAATLATAGAPARVRWPGTVHASEDGWGDVEFYRGATGSDADPNVAGDPAASNAEGTDGPLASARAVPVGDGRSGRRTDARAGRPSGNEPATDTGDASAVAVRVAFGVDVPAEEQGDDPDGRLRLFARPTGPALPSSRVRLPGQSTETDPGTLAVGLHEHLLARVEAAASTPDRLRREWRCRAIDLGRPVAADRLERGVRGQAVDVTRDGALLVATTDGRTRLRPPAALPDG